MQVALRAVESGDLALFFEHQRDAEAVRLAGATSRDRPAFDEQWNRILADPHFTIRTISVDGVAAGYISAFPRSRQMEIAYWLGRDHWRKSVGRQALAAFIAIYVERPLFASVAVENLGSLAILRRCGFITVDELVGPNGNAELLLRLS